MSDELPDTPKRRRLAVIAPPPLEPVAEVVDLLRDWLIRAERGEIIEIAAAWVTSDLIGDHARTDMEYGTVVLGELRLVGDEISDALRNADE